MTCDLIIIGAGAAGLFAACEAADAGLKAMLVERRHRPGLKLLMCGNNRCNLSHDGTAAKLLSDYGEPVSGFLTPAITALPPAALRRWFTHLGLETKILGDRIYPASEKGDDVLHAFMDHLRDREFPVLFNCPVTALRQIDGGYRLESRNTVFEAPNLLLATGGFSYPRTGSVGDGQRFGAALGLKTEPPRAGLVGLELPPHHILVQTGPTPLEWSDAEASLPGAGTVSGGILFDRGILRGSAVFDLTRIAARKQLTDYTLTIDFFPKESLDDLRRRWEKLSARVTDLRTRLNALGFPPLLAAALASIPRLSPELLKQFRLEKLALRPLKEAIVTVGGLSMAEFRPETCEALRFPGLFAAGEVLDIDGPTGGYNLEAAFATAHLAVAELARRLKHYPLATPYREEKEAPAHPMAAAPRPPMHRPTPPPQKSSWGPHFWDGHRFGRR